MTAKARLAQLQTLAQVTLDARLADLRAAAACREASLARLADLALPVAHADLPPMAAAGIALRYQLWADHRRSEINLALARQTADWIEKRATATRAFGQAQALAALGKRL